MKHSGWAWRWMALLFCGWLLSGLARAEEEPLVVELTKDWNFERIWKDAHLNKENFYKGKLGLRNPGQTPLEGVTAVFAIFAPDGTKIDQSKPVDFGTLEPGTPVVKEFLIDKGLQFAELSLIIRAKGRTALELSSYDGTCPTDLSQSPGGLAVLSRSIDLPKRLPTKRGATVSAAFNCRVRNLNSYPVSELKVRLTFLAEKAPVKRKTTAKTDSKTTAPAAEKDAPEGTVVEASLNVKTLQPGETKVFSGVKLKDVPAEFTSYSVEILSSHAGSKGALDNAIGGGLTVITKGEGGSGSGLQVGSLQIRKGKETVAFTLTSHDVTIKNGVTVELELKNESGKVVKTIHQKIEKEFPKGKAVAVEVGTSGSPAFLTCDIGVSYDEEVAPAQ